MLLNLFKKKNIWVELKNRKKENNKSIFILAPMLDVTDRPFRQIIAKLGAPDIFFTEFVSVDGLSSKEGRKRLILILNKTRYEKVHNNLVFQIFGSNPEKFSEAVKLIKKLKPAGIDINTGCPVKAIIRQNAGSALMKLENRELMKKIFIAVKKESEGIPISIKTRIGFYEKDMDWIRFLLELKPAALTVHFRTQKEMSKVDAHWDLAKEIHQMKEKISPETVLVGNGDVESKNDGEQKVKDSGFDGVMVGRGIFNNPTFFQQSEATLFSDFSILEKFKIMFEHLDLFEKEFFKDGRWIKSFALMKKFFKIYINGFDGAKELRAKLMEVRAVKEIKDISKEYLENNVLK